MGPASWRIIAVLEMALIVVCVHLFGGIRQMLLWSADDTIKSIDSVAAKYDRESQNMDDMVSLYLDTVRDSLTGTLIRSPGVVLGLGEGDKLRRIPFNAEQRKRGAIWCDFCFSMAGTFRLDNVRQLVERTILSNVSGDFAESGTWRGGSSIMARAVQRVRGEGMHRRVWVCDSFDGLPKPSQKKDRIGWSRMDFLRVTTEEVSSNFASFRLLDDNVRFVKGYFMNSLPPLRQQFKNEKRSLAVLRGDGDMYESYLDILYNLYEFVSVGGYFICDDCRAIRVADMAIAEFRATHNIKDEIENISGQSGTYWQKSFMTSVKYDWYLEWNATRHSAA